MRSLYGNLGYSKLHLDCVERFFGVEELDRCGYLNLICDAGEVMGYRKSWFRMIQLWVQEVGLKALV